RDPVQHHPVLHTGLARELERRLVVLAEARDGKRAPGLIVDADRPCRLCVSFSRRADAARALGVQERRRAHHRDRQRQLGGGARAGDVGDVETQDRRLERGDLARRPVEHAAQRAAAQAHQRERELAQALASGDAVRTWAGVPRRQSRVGAQTQHATVPHGVAKTRPCRTEPPRGLETLALWRLLGAFTVGTETSDFWTVTWTAPCARANGQPRKG